MGGERIAFLSPGQGAPISPTWADASNIDLVAGKISETLPDGPDVKTLLQTPEQDRQASALNAHLLLTAVVGLTAEQLLPQMRGRLDAVTGHSAGLPASLGLTPFYGEGIERIKGLARVMERRGSLLMEAQAKHPGKMFAINWRGRNGLSNLVQWITEYNTDQADPNDKITVACFNLDTPEETQLVVTVDRNLDVSGLLKEKFPGKKVRIFPLKIAVGAHSWRVSDAADEFRRFLLGEFNAGRLHDLPKGAVFVSDYLKPGVSVPIVSYLGPRIITALSEFDRPVQFHEVMKHMAKVMKIGRVIEVGAETLSNLIRKMGLKVQVDPILTPQDLDRAVTSLANLEEI